MATPRVAAGVLFRDQDGRMLLVKPSHRPGRDAPHPNEALPWRLRDRITSAPSVNSDVYIQHRGATEAPTHLPN